MDRVLGAPGAALRVVGSATAAGRAAARARLVRPVTYTLLSHVANEPEMRAADLAEHYALDKSTVSRQIDALEQRGLLRAQARAPAAEGRGPSRSRSTVVSKRAAAGYRDARSGAA